MALNVLVKCLFEGCGEVEPSILRFTRSFASFVFISVYSISVAVRIRLFLVKMCDVLSSLAHICQRLLSYQTSANGTVVTME